MRPVTTAEKFLEAVYMRRCEEARRELGFKDLDIDLYEEDYNGNE